MERKDRLVNRARARTKNGMRGTNFRNGKVGGMARKDSRYHCRGCPDHEILPVIPDPTYTNSGVQPSTDNRTGYVVDLAGNIYELLLPRSFLFSFFSLFVIRSLQSLMLLFLLMRVLEPFNLLLEICTSALTIRISHSVFHSGYQRATHSVVRVIY